MPLIYTLTGGRTYPRVFVQNDPRARALRGRPPRCTMLRVHKNRMWAAGDPDFSSRLYFSEILNAEQWEPVDFEDQNQDFLVPSDAGYREIEPNDGEKIRAIGYGYRGLMPVYKDHSIHYISGTSASNFGAAQITDRVGAVNHFAVANVANDQYFVSPFGVHALSATEKFGDLEDTFISRDIRDWWKDNVNVGALHQACVLVNNEALDRVEILVPVYESGEDAFTPNRVLCLNYGVRPQAHPFGLWSVKKLKGRAATTTRMQGSSRSRFLIGGTDGYLNLQDQESAIDFPVYGKRTITKSNTFVLDLSAAAKNCQVNLTDNTISTSASPIEIGIVGGDRTAGGFIFDAPAIPQGSRIVRAEWKVSFTTSSDATNRYVNLRLWGELDRAPSSYSTFADFVGRSRTVSFVDVSDVETYNGSRTLVFDLAPILQEVLDLSGWTGNVGTSDQFALQIWDNGSFPSPFGTSDADEINREFAIASATQMTISVEYWSV